MVWLALLVIAVAVVFVLKGVDVRLVLLAAALLLGALASDLKPILREFLGTLSNEKFVIPICSAMGFAYVLKATRCDTHMVRVLMLPLSYVTFLLVPGVVLVGFVVNIPIISQASSAVCLGTVVVPLMRAAGFSSATIGATLLFNPGAPELNSVREKAGGDTRDTIPYVATLLLPMLAIATVSFWLLSRRDARVEPTVTEAKTQERLNPLKAMVPLVPLVLLFISGPPFSLIEIAPDWVVPADPSGKADSRTTGRLIGLAMLLGTLVAALVSGREAKNCMKSFFEGAGYGFTNIISIIVTANCFGKGIELVGLAEHLKTIIENSPQLLQPLAGFVPFGFAWVSGSGMASTQSLYGFFYGPTMAQGSDPLAVGALVSIGAAAGRTMSPAAAVVFMCCTLSGAKPAELIRRVAPPLVLSLATIVLLRTFAWW
jgi:C4-dicarboxylate transporter, DcuC family